MVKKHRVELQDLAAERAVLAGICQYGIDIYIDIDFLCIEHFSNHINQAIFKCLDLCIKKNMKIELASILSTAHEFNYENLLSTDNEIGFLRSLFNYPVSKENTHIFAAKLAKIKLIKDFNKTIKNINSELDILSGEEEVEEIISVIETPIQNQLNEVYNTSNNKPQKIGEQVGEYLENLFNNPNTINGVSSGFPLYDMSIGGGLRRKCVDVIGARTKVGKSLFADSVALNVALKRNIPVLMIDTEMDTEDHLNRILANLSTVPLNDISAGLFDKDPSMKTKLIESAKLINKMPYSYINVSGRDFDHILAVARQWIYQEVGFDENGRTNDCLIIYDYLKMMDSKDISDATKEYQILGFQATKLHNFCVKHDVPCLTFIQLNRDGITKESTDVASGSDRIMWLCTSFSILKEKTIEEIADDRSNGSDKKYIRKIVPVISRHGGGLDPGDYINIEMRGEYARMNEGKTRNQIMRNNDTIDRKQSGNTDIGSV